MTQIYVDLVHSMDLETQDPLYSQFIKVFFPNNTSTGQLTTMQLYKKKQAMKRVKTRHVPLFCTVLSSLKSELHGAGAYIMCLIQILTTLIKTLFTSSCSFLIKLLYLRCNLGTTLPPNQAKWRDGMNCIIILYHHEHTG